MTASIIGHALHVPSEGDCSPEQAHTLLGRKGLLGKDPATRLALCAVHRALGLPLGKPTLPLPGAVTTGVVVSSNLGNIDTVRSAAALVRAGERRSISPMDIPNASSNVIAGAIAIRFGFTGPNLTLCSGRTSGIDALRHGSRLIAADRADRVVVVGVEPDCDLVETTAVAACVVLSREPGALALDLGTTPAALTLEDDPLGEIYGALGVVQAVRAAEWLSAGSGPDALLTCGDNEDGYASIRVVAR
ncbi:beta-ketoacyl synthase N-terminal-like domain-containing protein [Actinokineospora diospyrosa]|uniref:Beta-ketoacyl synthase, N-terminal domain n=1 Tax=Actinokineospora diospyrosa TaxID=103728 RepID=A0ABT1I9T3_9PSEU|nr:beta-ketoacyl synthase N-terminal-like domain-containing protein [Actinokineospora diospyrosa]MCP2269400.1 Beta-ketoacyl synthase, N-terminal domain [Actinokineospora diospyrosa]